VIFIIVSFVDWIGDNRSDTIKFFFTSTEATKMFPLTKKFPLRSCRSDAARLRDERGPEFVIVPHRPRAAMEEPEQMIIK
jgi:hypothetical protein